MGSAMKKIGKGVEGFFGAADQMTVQSEQLGMPPTPEQGALSTAGDAFTLAKSAATIAKPGAAPNSAWGNALVSGGKLGLSMLSELLMPGQGAMMAGVAMDQAKAAGDMMLPGGVAGTVGDVFHQITGLGGGKEEEEGAHTPAPAQAQTPAAPAPLPVPTPVAPPVAAAPAAPQRDFPNSPLTDEEVRERLSR